MFEHVEQDWLRDILNGDVSEKSLDRALTYTRVCLEEDSRNEDVSYERLDRRLEDLEDAEYQYEVEGDMVQALESLRNVWA
jgi:hypothetical protein